MKLLVNRSLRRVVALFLAVVALFCVLGMNYSENRRVVAEDDGAYTLVTDASTLAVDDKIVIAAKDYDYALSTTQNGNNRGQAAITKNGNTITVGTDVQEITLEKGNKEGTFAFNVGTGYLYAASSSKNYLRTETTLSDNSSWTIEIATDGTATIKAQGTYTHNLMQYNGSSSLFSSYSSAQQTIVIYKFEAVVSGGDGSCAHTNWGEYVETTAATCTTAGEKTRTCADCNVATQTLTIDALGHDWSDPVTDKAATCTTDGSGTKTCSRCSETETVVLEAEGHDYIVETVTEASCKEAGKIVTTCSKCDYNEEEIVAKTNNHVWDETACTVCGIAKPSAFTYVKVTEAPTDWSGTYLIVYEDGNVAFNSSLGEDKLDSTENSAAVTISDGAITGADLPYFIIEKFGSGYSIKTPNGLYIGRSGTSNGMEEDSVIKENSISFADGKVSIKSAGGPTLQYYLSGSNSRFRYYASEQKPIALYKLQPLGVEEFEAIEINPTLQFSGDTENYTVNVRFGATIDTTVLATLKSQGATFGMEVESSIDGEGTLGPWAPAENGNFALVIKNIENNENAITAKMYVEIDGVKYYTAEVSCSVKSLAEWYLNKSGYTFDDDTTMVLQQLAGTTEAE